MIIPTLKTGSNTRLLITACQKILAFSKPQLQFAELNAAQAIIESQWNIQRVYPSKHEDLVAYGLPVDHHLFTGLSILTTAAHASTGLHRNHVASLRDFVGWTKTLLKVANELLEFQNAHGDKILDKHCVVKLAWYLPILDLVWQYPKIKYHRMAQIHAEINSVARGETPLVVRRTNLDNGEVELFEMHRDYLKEIKQSLDLLTPPESETGEVEEVESMVGQKRDEKDENIDLDNEKEEGAHSDPEFDNADIEKLQQYVESLDLLRDNAVNRLEELRRTHDELNNELATNEAADLP